MNTQKTKRDGLWAGVVLLFAVGGGCGVTTDLDVCNANCNTALQCNLKSESQTTTCHADCNNNAGFHQQADITLQMQCSNPGEVRQAQITCNGNSDACNLVALAACQLTALNKCMKK